MRWWPRWRTCAWSERHTAIAIGFGRTPSFSTVGRLAGSSVGKPSRVAVSPGSHVAMLKLDWCSSPRLTFSVSPGEFVILACHPGGSALSAPWHFLFARGHYIAIDRVE